LPSHNTTTAVPLRATTATSAAATFAKDTAAVTDTRDAAIPTTIVHHHTIRATTNLASNTATDMCRRHERRRGGGQRKRVPEDAVIDERSPVGTEGIVIVGCGYGSACNTAEAKKLAEGGWSWRVGLVGLVWQ